VTDFGLSKNMAAAASTQATKNNVSGTIAYMAPEIHNSTDHTPPYSEKSDMFAFGIMCWEIGERVLPWNSLNAGVIISRVIQGKRMEFTDATPVVIRNVATKAWCQEPKERLSASACVDMLVKHK